MAFYANWYDLENLIKDHRKELLAEAASERLLKTSKRNNAITSRRVRQWLGRQLVWGCWLYDSIRAPDDFCTFKLDRTSD